MEIRRIGFWVMFALLCFVRRGEAGCGEICQQWPRPDFSVVSNHCCCADYRETPCHCAPQPTATVEPCPVETPTPLPTPDSHAKSDCCKQAILIYREAKRAALSRYHAGVYYAASRKRDQRRMCQDGDEHAE